MLDEDDELKAGRGRYRSARQGPQGRTFHCRVGSITRRTGGAAKAIAGLDYDARRGAHSRRADELELEGGRPRTEMAAILRAAEASNCRANGKVALDLEVELPLASTPAQRRAIVERVAAFFEAQGCPCHWALHVKNGDKRFQPHAHMTAAARPVRQIAGQWVGTAPGQRGAPGPRPAIAGPEAMRHFRREVVAAAINAVCPGLAWHGGRLAETGIDRPAKARLPMAVYNRLEAIKDGPSASNCLIAQGRYSEARRDRAAWLAGRKATQADKAAEAESRRLAHLDRLGAIDKGVLRKAAAESRLRIAGKMMVPEDCMQSEITALRQATARQVALIIAMAKEVGVSIAPEQITALDGGDLVAALRAAKAGDRNAFEAKIAAAEARAARAEAWVAAPMEEMKLSRPEKTNLPPLAPAPLRLPEKIPAEVLARLRAQIAAASQEQRAATVAATQAAFRRVRPGTPEAAEYRRGLALLGSEVPQAPQRPSGGRGHSL